jgi:hypothetical protein
MIATGFSKEPAFPDNSFELVLAPFVFCSMADPIPGLPEAPGS